MDKVLQKQERASRAVRSFKNQQAHEASLKNELRKLKNDDLLHMKERNKRQREQKMENLMQRENETSQYLKHVQS